MSLLNRIEQITLLWELVVPSVQTPSPAWISRWCSYDDASIERGIARAAKKFGNSVNTEPEQVYQYVCGVARNEFEDKNRG